MSDSFEFTLHSPLTEEDWSKISDAEHENTKSVTFQTPQGRQVRYIKCEVLDKIRAEIEEYKSRQLAFAIGVEDLEHGKQLALEYVLAILDEYKAESEE